MFQQRAFIICSLLHFFILCTAEDDVYRVTVEGANSKLHLTCEDLALTCRITPAIENTDKVVWFLNSTKLTFENRTTIGTKDCKPSTCVTLNIKCLELADAGNYTCGIEELNNTETAVNRALVVNVHDPVRVENSTGSFRIRAAQNESAELWCRFKGHNIKDITWRKIDDPDISLNHREVEEKDYVDSYLTVKDIRGKNGTYLCSAADGKVTAEGSVHLFVLDVPHITLQTVTVMGARRVFMNWTLNDGNSKNVTYSVKYFTNSSKSWQFYGEEISGKNRSCIIKNLEPNTTYWFSIKPRNENGDGTDYQTDALTTLDKEPDYIPEVKINGIGPNSVNIAWTVPSVDSKNQVHYFKLIMFNENVKKETIVNPDSFYMYAFTNLESATTYSFQVAACNEFTNECGNYSKVVNGTTLDGVSGPPVNVTVICKYDEVSHLSSVFVSWSPPKNPNGEIFCYNAVIFGNASYINETGELAHTTFGPKTKNLKNDTLSTVFEKLTPNTNYTIQVSAVTRSRGSSDPAIGYCTMPPTVPDEDHLNAFDWTKHEEKDSWYFKLPKPRLSERNGAICCFKVFVVKLKSQQTSQQLPAPEKNQVSSYEYVHNVGEGTYMADIFDKGSLKGDIVVGDENAGVLNYKNSKCHKCPVSVPKVSIPLKHSTISYPQSSTPAPPANAYSHYSTDKLMADAITQNLSGHDSEYLISPSDGALDKDSNYTGFMQIIVYGKDSFIPAYSRYFTVMQPGPAPLKDSQATGLFGSTLFHNISFQILCGMIAISIMMLAAVCLLQHYTKQVAEAQGVEMTLRNSFRHLCRSLRGSHLPVSSNPPDVLPISKAALLSTFAELAKDSDYGFEQEFEMLPDRFTDRTTKASEARENASKNRYPDIKAYDQTRVKLSQIDGILGSDYINANFVISYKERKKFICAQGPMDATVCDFWRMIWEQHLEIVLMLTNLEEYSKTKCAKYWPDKEEEKKIFGDIAIHYVNEKRYSDYVIRELKMVRTTGTGPNRDPEERSIFQYHFLMWKDFQAPEHPSGILKFIWRVNEAYSLEKGPILVHCSAGVGRTGTLVAIDSLLQQLENEGQVQIFNTICDLRHQRNFLVQSLKQYIFVYRALVEYAQFGNTEIKASNLKATVEKLKQSDNGKMQIRLEEEYEKLSFTVNSHDLKSTAVGSLPENATKNRSQSIIPYDKSRVILTPIPGREQTTYINASFIEGYDNTESFIITQDPILDVTVVDFWRMISEQNLTTIVMLSSAASDALKKTGRYWPDDEFAYGNVNVKHIQSESCPYYTRREFYIVNLKTDENLVVTQYQYNGWPTVEGEVPEVTRGLIELMDHATQHAGTSGTGPLLVHCELGSDRSSMFVALCILAQQLKVERRVDVVSVARKLRSQRQGMLTSYAQYEFLYRAILNYVDLHHLLDVESD